MLRDIQRCLCGGLKVDGKCENCDNAREEVESYISYHQVMDILGNYLTNTDEMIDYILKGLKQHPTIMTDKYKLSLLKENVDTVGKHYMIGITTEYKGYEEGDEDEKIE